jgi:hypothetical protein
MTRVIQVFISATFHKQRFTKKSLYGTGLSENKYIGRCEITHPAEQCCGSESESQSEII